MELIMIRSIWFLPVENYPNLRPTPQARTLLLASLKMKTIRIYNDNVICYNPKNFFNKNLKNLAVWNIWKLSQLEKNICSRKLVEDSMLK